MQADKADGRRVVVTGIGSVSPLGLCAGDSWRGLIEGRSAVGPILSFDASTLPVRIAACVKGFDPACYMDRREARRMAPFTQYALAAAAEAVAHAGLNWGAEDPTRVGVTLGSALGGIQVVEDQRALFDQRGPQSINPALIAIALVNTPACSLAIRYGIRGPVLAPVAACATGVVAIGEAARSLAHGDADVALAGATDSVMTSLTITGFARLGALSTKNDRPESACAPFDAGRDGTVVGEGAAVLVLETLAHARRRSAAILAEVAGYGLTCDAHHLVAPDPTGAGASRAILAAMKDACVSAGDVDWICAHGTGTQLNDVSETRAIKLALGERAHLVPVSSIKGAVGHMLGAAGAMSVVAGILAMQTGQIPPTLNYHTPDPECDLDYVPNVARQSSISTIMANGFGFGGQNACVVLRKWGEGCGLAPA